MCFVLPLSSVVVLTNSYPSISFLSFVPVSFGAIVLPSSSTYSVTTSGMNSHVPFTFSSLSEIVTSFLSYDLNFQVPLFTSSLYSASFPVGTGDVTLSPFTFPVASFGAFAFNASGNSMPFVPLTYSYVTLCSFGVNFHSPSNFTSAPFTFASTSSVVLSWSL